MRIGTLTFILLLTGPINIAAQQKSQRAPRVSPLSPAQQPIERPRFIKAFIIDDRLSALRRAPHLQSMVIRRVRLGQSVYIVGTPHLNTAGGRADETRGQPKFYRVAVTRRTRGWMHASALAIQGRAGEDQRIMALIESSKDPVERITLTRIIIERFGRSRLIPSAMLLLANEAEHVARTLSQRTRRRLADAGQSEASLRDYYLSDAGLDRYSRLGIAFDFNESTGEFAYDGDAYRELVRRFPGSEEASLARQHLEQVSRNRVPTP